MSSLVSFMVFVARALFMYIIATTAPTGCRHDNIPKLRQFHQLGKLYATTVLCEDLSPESVTMETVCLSPCANPHMEELKCNAQAETWKIRLRPDGGTSYFDATGCRRGQRRFKCFPYKSNEGECDDESALTYSKGYSCFTKCGVKTCPSESFKKPNDVEDLKVADCSSGFRVRCSFSESGDNRAIGTGNLTLELKKKSKKL